MADAAVTLIFRTGVSITTLVNVVDMTGNSSTPVMTVTRGPLNTQNAWGPDNGHPSQL